MTISNTTAAKNMAQEALETPAQTKAEAARGDQQAARRLASKQADNRTPAAQQPTETVDSDRGRLDSKA